MQINTNYTELYNTKSQPEMKVTVVGKFRHADFEIEVHSWASRHHFQVLATLDIYNAWVGQRGWSFLEK